MRALKTILIIVLAVVGLYLLFCLIADKKAHAEKSIVINASPEVVYEEARFLKNMNDYGVWYKRDTAAKYEMTGTDGTVGAKQTWDGKVNKQGSFTITGLDPNKSMTSDLAFGDFMVSQVVMSFEPKDGGTNVNWTLDGEVPFMGRGMMMLMSMGDQTGNDFEAGLENLKAICEGKQAAAKAEQEEMLKAFNITTADRPATLYVGTRALVKWADMHGFFAKNLPAAFTALGKAQVVPAGPPVGVYFTWDTLKKETDMLAGVAIAADAKGKVQGMTEYETPASKACQTVYTGPYSGMGKAHDAMAVKMKMDHVAMNQNVIEEYVSDPGKEADSTKWVTNIIYLVK